MQLLCIDSKIQVIPIVVSMFKLFSSLDDALVATPYAFSFSQTSVKTAVRTTIV